MTALEQMKARAAEFNRLKAEAVKSGTNYVRFNGQNFYFWGGTWHERKPTGWVAKFETQFEDKKIIKKYEIHKNICEIPFENKMEIVKGCTVQQSDYESECIESFVEMEEAMDVLNSYRSEIDVVGDSCSYYLVTEYFVVKNEYDEDGKILAGNDLILAFSEMPEVEI